MNLRTEKFARRFNLLTILAVYLLILVGGIVRSTGAGMGCPDWPKCFGSYIPPSSESELPDGYREVYVQKRLEKNQRLMKVLTTLGMSGLAEQLAESKEIGRETYFDPQKAWIEYVNRLIGVLIGILIIINAWATFSYWSSDRAIAVMGLAALVLVIFQGWVGSLVVSTNLLTGFITFHMVLALILVTVLIYQQVLLRKKRAAVAGRWYVNLLLPLFFVQIVLGTQVREQVDVLAAGGMSRLSWIENLGTTFYIHRSFSILLVIVAIGWVYRTFREGVRSPLTMSVFGVIMLEVLLGVLMAYFAVPAVAQPLHLFLGTVAFGLIFYLFLEINFKAGSS